MFVLRKDFRGAGSHGLAFVVAGLVAVAACGGDGNAGDPSESGGGKAAGQAVSVKDFKFSPATVTVKAGGTVTFTNGDAQAHTATADSGNAFDAGAIAVGTSATVKVPAPGTYPYHCSYHPFMK
ncbi:MAG: cupredoxin domain-containing protein, partial [Acidimicrobiia bacterium]